MTTSDEPERYRSRLSTRVVIFGLALIAVALTISVKHFAPDLVTTIGGVVGFTMVMVGVTASFSGMIESYSAPDSDFDR